MTRVRLDRLLGNLGYGSRKDVAGLVRAGLVMRDGVAMRDASDSIDIADARAGLITIDGEICDPPAPMTVMLNKPAGYTCSHDEAGMIVYDLLPGRWMNRKPALSCAGRLDKDSTGQVILTDDGDLLHRIIHPKSHAEKRYAVMLEKPLRGDEADLFSTGTFLMKNDPKPLKPALWAPDGPQSGVMTLTEGRFHQIRRMFATLDNRVVGLHRFQTGGLALGDLPAGAYRALNEQDISTIFSDRQASP